MQALIPNAVGTGIKQRSAHPDANVRGAMHRLTIKSLYPAILRRYTAISPSAFIASCTLGRAATRST